MRFFSGYRVNNKRRRVQAVRTARRVPTQVAPRPNSPRPLIAMRVGTVPVAQPVDMNEYEVKKIIRVRLVDGRWDAYCLK